MKYGQTLQQRSIPEWGPYNVDYNDIKNLIKAKTTQERPQAIDIPGSSRSSSNANADFEEQLFEELLEQHERIDLFVKSKSGEIKRRLDHLNKQVNALRRRDFPVSRNRLPIARLEKWSKAEEDVLKAGDEIQALSRFVGAQRLAFTKLLKKYRKWTSSSSLELRFTKEVLGNPQSFCKQDFESLLTQWTQVLYAVRAPFEGGVRTESGKVQQDDIKETPATSPPVYAGTGREMSNTFRGVSNPECEHLHMTAESGSDVEFDTALALSSLGTSSNKASYWVHADHLIELQVLLLQYTRMRVAPRRRRNSSATSSSRPSRRQSEDRSSKSPTETADDEGGLIICDDLDRFAQDQSKATVNDIEHGIGRVPERAMVSVRWAPNGEAVVALQESPESSETKPSVNKAFRQIKMKKKHVESILPTHSTSNLTKLPTNGEGSGGNDQDLQSWLAGHPSVRPLVEVRSRRLRFVGLGNDDRRGVWATLDRDVTMQKAGTVESRRPSGDDTGEEPEELESAAFPHAILELRCEGDAGLDLLQILDSTHLTERVRGFSMEAHAVTVLCKPANLPPLFWLPILEKDIRKLPTGPKATKRRTVTHLSPPSSNAKSNSTSATSLTDVPPSSGSAGVMVESSATSVPDLLESPPLSSFKKKRRKIREHPLRKEVDTYATPQKKYWNEYDDGDERPEDEPYTIFVDPNASSYLPSSATLVHLAHTIITDPIKKTADGLKSYFMPLPSTRLMTSITQPHHRHEPNEHTPLTHDYFSQTLEEAETSSTSSSTASVRGRYATFPPTTSSSSPAQDRERLLTRSSTACFLVSIFLLLIQSVFASVTRWSSSDLTMGLDTGIVIGAIASIGFAMLALGLLLLKRESLSWTRAIAVTITCVAVCVGSASLLAVVGAES
ncbi:MAG: hypothetical protein M4579_006936 [Chaenotheca gracillima]|nr:MAG: hypothetical protein M4579_006936 [Chaenotheca gracillima]